MLTNHGYNYVVIAENCDDLVDGTIQHPIDHDEYGGPKSDNQWYVWTGTDRYGYAYGPNMDCGQWSSSSADGWVGDLNQTDYGRWTSRTSRTCNALYSLYCFQIQKLTKEKTFSRNGTI